MLLFSSAAMAGDTSLSNPANWPTGKMKLGANSDGGGVVTMKFTDADGKTHDVELSYDFMNANIYSCTFDGWALDTVPQWRALFKFFTDNHMGSYRTLDVLACTHPGADKANENAATPDCKSWKDTREDAKLDARAADIAKNGPPSDPALAAKVGLVLYVRVISSTAATGAAKWNLEGVHVLKVIKNDPKATFDKDQLNVATPVGRRAYGTMLSEGEGTIYLEQVKDDSGNPMWQLLGGSAKSGSSHWLQ
jgi:hypothetical protein